MSPWARLNVMRLLVSGALQLAQKTDGEKKQNETINPAAQPGEQSYGLGNRWRC